MSDFATAATITIDGVEGLSSARQQIENNLGSVSVGAGGTGSAQRAVRSDGGSSGRRGRRMFRWARQRTSLMETSVELLDSIEDKVGDGGGGGAIGGALGGMGLRSLLGGGAGAIGGASLGALVSKVPLKSLITKVPAFATLVTAADLGADLVTGSLTADDIIEAPIEVGEMLTFGAIDNDAIEGAIGATTLSIGAVQIAGGLGSLLPTVGLGTVLGGMSSAGLAKLLGTVGIGVVLGKMSGDALEQKLGTTGLGNILGAVGGGAALAALLGTVSLGAVVGGTLGSVVIGSAVIDQWVTPSEETLNEIDSRYQPGSNRYQPGLDERTDPVPGPNGEDPVDGFDPSNVDISSPGSGQNGDGWQPSSGPGGVQVEYAPQYDISAERDEDAIIEEVRSQQEDDLDELREEIRRAGGGR